jgi:hypothetical protein
MSGRRVPCPRRVGRWCPPTRRRPWLRLTGVAEPTVLLPRAGRDCGTRGGRKVRRMPWGAGHRSGVPGTAAPGCPDGRADRTAAAVAASACWQILRLRGRASGLRCPLRTGRGLQVSAATGSGRRAGVRCSGAASAARPATPAGPGGRGAAPGRRSWPAAPAPGLPRFGWADAAAIRGARGSRSTASGACGSGSVHHRCCSAGASCLSASCMNRFCTHRSALVVALVWAVESSVRGGTAGPRCPPQPRSGPRRSCWLTGSASARRRGRTRERTRHRAPAQD